MSDENRGNDYVLMPSDEAIVPGLEMYEVILGKNQAGVNQIRVLPGMKATGEVLMRFKFSELQRQVVADGGDLYVELRTFQLPMQPILAWVAGEVFDDPRFAYDVADQYGLEVLPK
jgi:hypothetical protein